MEQRVQFSVTRFAAWAPGIETDADWQTWRHGERAMSGDAVPSLSQMPPLLRRHAGKLGRLACDVAYRTLDGAQGVPTVFCSRYGEVGRSVELLSALAAGSPLSPTSFGLSVHNAAMGLLSMARRDTANCIAIAAGEASAAHGVIEACGLLGDGADRVLLVVADCALPAVYEPFADVTPANFAWACFVQPPAERAIALEWGPASTEKRNDRRQPAALDVLRFLWGGDSDLIHTAGRRRWHWNRDV